MLKKYLTVLLLIVVTTGGVYLYYDVNIQKISLEKDIAALGEQNDNAMNELTAEMEKLKNTLLAIATESGIPMDSDMSSDEIQRRVEVIQKSQEDLLVEAVEKVSPAVVSVVVSKDVPLLEMVYENPFGDDPFFQGIDIRVPRYRQKGSVKKEIGAGTGFIVGTDGMIVTNKHVVSDTEAEYTVLLSNEEQAQAQVLARDPKNDIAILKINADNLTAVPLGDSGKLKPGQTVAAIGNALGEFSNSVSVGIVSGLGRSITAGNKSGQSEQLTDVIQTDAAINPGNSGGPLINLQGEVIGVNVATVIGSDNIGFALPINDVKKIVEQVKTTGKISRPFMGIRYAANSEELKATLGLTTVEGIVLITEGNSLAVVPGSPADKAGLQSNDIILEINDNKVSSIPDLEKILKGFDVGDKVKLKVVRADQTLTVEITLEEIPV